MKLTVTFLLVIYIAVFDLFAGLLPSSLPQESAAVLHYEKLIEYIDISIPGYNKQEPDGATMNIGGNSYSTATIKYVNANGDKIILSLFDYNAVAQLYMASSMMWTAGFSIDTPEEKASGIEISEKIRGWESEKKKEKKSSVILGIGNRFIFSIDADSENLEFCHNIRKKIDLNQLATK